MLEALLHQIAVMGRSGAEICEQVSNFALGFVDAMKPQDAAEVALLTQMAVTHQTIMTFARLVNLSHTDARDNLTQWDCRVF